MSAKKRRLGDSHSSAEGLNDTREVNPADSKRCDELSPSDDQPSSFRDLGILDALCEACDSLGYRTPTPIQAQCIPVALQGRDLIGLAETGSGKTAAFVLPILQALMDNPQPLRALIISPTRELAQQTSHVVEALGALISVQCALLIGGVDMVSQAIALGRKPHVVVATPGRLLDDLENTKDFSLWQLKHLVLDEADRLLDLDFGPVLDKVLKVLPRRATYLFSATMFSKVESLQRASVESCTSGRFHEASNGLDTPTVVRIHAAQVQGCPPSPYAERTSGTDGNNIYPDN